MVDDDILVSVDRRTAGVVVVTPRRVGVEDLAGNSPRRLVTMRLLLLLLAKHNVRPALVESSLWPYKG